MRGLTGVAVAVSLFLWATPASAQFQNHSIGFDLGEISLTPGVGLLSTYPVPALALDGSLYFESGFDLALRFGLGIQSLREVDHDVVSIYPALAFRYLLLQDYFRPYVGGELSFLYIFDDTQLLQTQSYVGLGPVFGFDYFVAENWSVGLSLSYSVLGMLNVPVEGMFQGWARVGTHF